MHAWNGHEVCGRRSSRVVAFEIGVNANPVHLAAAHNLLFANDRNIVFRLAGNRAAIAADAIVEVYRHAPGVTHALCFVVVLFRIVERLVFSWYVGFMIIRAVMQILFQRLRTQDVAVFFAEVAIFHVEVELGNREQILLRAFLYRHTGGRPGRIRRANLVGVKSVIVANSTGATATVAKMQSDNAVRMTRRDPGGNGVANRFSCVRDLERVDMDVATLLANRFSDSELLSGVWTN